MSTLTKMVSFISVFPIAAVDCIQLPAGEVDSGKCVYTESGVRCEMIVGGVGEKSLLFSSSSSFLRPPTGGIAGTLYHGVPVAAAEHLDSASNRNISILILKSFCRCLFFHVSLDYSSHTRLPRYRIGKNNTFPPLSWHGRWLPGRILQPQ